MANKYSREEVKSRLKRALFQVVRKEGIEGVTVRKISKASELSDPYIYQCYKNLGEMMSAAFLEIDQEMADLVESMLQDTTVIKHAETKLEEACWIMWNTFWKFLMKDPEKTIFYWRYYQSACYTQKFLKRRRNVLQQCVIFMKKAGADPGIMKAVDLEVIVSDIIDSTFLTAVKTHQGYIRKAELKIQMVYQSVFGLLFHLLHIDVWDESYM